MTEREIDREQYLRARGAGRAVFDVTFEILRCMPELTDDEAGRVCQALEAHAIEQLLRLFGLSFDERVSEQRRREDSDDARAAELKQQALAAYRQPTRQEGGDDE
jgi:hypothetical protein